MRVYWAQMTAPTGRLLEERLRPVRSTRDLNWGRNMSPVEVGAWSRSSVINPPPAVGRTSNKLRMRQQFQVRGVPSPRLYSKEEAIILASQDVPILARTTYHTRGSGLWVCRNPEDVEAACLANRRRGRPAASHFMEVLGLDHPLIEYRVHIVGDRCVKISEKYLDEGTAVPGPDSQVVVRSHRYGWKFRVPQTRRRRELRAAAKQAVSALGLDIGAADILQDPNTKETWVLEVNAAPSLTDETSTTLRRYVDAITQEWGG